MSKSKHYEDYFVYTQLMWLCVHCTIIVIHLQASQRLPILLLRFYLIVAVCHVVFRANFKQINNSDTHNDDQKNEFINNR